MGTNRLTGLVSGLDTESLVSQLVSAYSIKKQQVEKEKTKLEWKQDKWKELNTKIYNLYSKTISNMQYTTAYQAKSTKVSDETKASVVASDTASKGTHLLSISQLAKAGQMTGAKLTGDNGKLKGTSTLSELGITSSASIKVKAGVNGEEKTIDIDGNMTLNQFTLKLKEAGINANFDEGQQRIYLSSKETGKENEFTLEGADASGVGALIKLGIVTEQQVVDSVTQDVQDEWVKWVGYQNAEISRDGSGAITVTGVDDGKAAEIKAFVEASYNKRLTEFTDAQNKTITEAEEKFNGTGLDIDAALANYKDYQAKLEAYNKGQENEVLTEDEKNALREASDAAYTKFIDSTKADGKAIISGDELLAYETAKNNLGKDYAERTSELSIAAQEEFWGKVRDAKDSVNTVTNLSSAQFGHRVEASNCIFTLDGVEYEEATNSSTINGLTISAKGTTVDPATGIAEEISIVTDNDYSKVYDNIKEFIKGYNELIIEMDKLFGADSAKGYEPLTDEEKEAMSETDIEKWENKIKDSLLRRDSTLDSVTQIMKNSMSATFEVNGKRMSLSDFGINTLSYFLAPDNEKGVYHIDGDEDDSSTSGNDNVLMKMITTDPETVTSFFTQLSKNLYTNLGNAMKGTELRSAYTVYNDKQIKSDLEDYDDKIDEWQEKLEYWEDYYYAKFAEMETALSKLESSSTSLSSLLGS